MKNSSILLAGVILTVALLLLFYFLDIFLLIAFWLGISLIGAVFIVMAVVTLITLIAIPYYLIKNKKEVQEYGSYKINDIEGKE